jgi:hypothetical protein
MDQPIAHPAPEGERPAEPGDIVESATVPAGAAVARSLSRPATFARIGLLGVAAAGLVAVAILAFASTASPNGILAAGNGSASGNAANGPTDLFNVGGPGLHRGLAGFREITITAINGNDISLSTADGWTRTITVDSGTTYSKGGASIGLGDLKVGDEIGFRQTREDSGTWTIDSIVVVLPHVAGEISKIDGSTITLTQRDGTTATVVVNANTKFDVDGNVSAALSDLKVGMVLMAEGARSDDALTATRVRAGTPGSFEGPRGHGDRGFGPGFGPGGEPDENGEAPSSTAAPTGGTAS